MMSAKLGDTNSVLLVMYTVETVLYGIGVLQAWLYFQWHWQDSWYRKSLVLLLTLLETIQIVFLYRAAYWHLIAKFGDINNLLVITWEDSAEITMMYTVTIIVQCYFGYSIWVLNRRETPMSGLWVTVFVWVLAAISFCAGITQIVITSLLGRFDHFEGTKVVTMVQSASALACDMIITVALCITLHSSRIDIPASYPVHCMVNKAIIFAVNRGIITSVCAGLNLILYLTVPATFWFTLGLAASSKLYINSILATLNAREYVMGGMEVPTTSPSIQFTTRSSQYQTTGRYAASASSSVPSSIDIVTADGRSSKAPAVEVV